MNPGPTIEQSKPRGVNVEDGIRECLQETLSEIAQCSDGTDDSARVTLEQFLTVLAHELRNPLAPLRNGIHILEERTEGEAPVRRVLQMMERQVQTISDLVDDLLDASQHWIEAAPASPRPTEPAAALRVLVVDDNEDAAQSLAEVLRLHEYDVDTASSTAGALAASAEHEFDAVILDIGLPDRDGYALARGLRAQPDRRYLLIALTGFGQDEDRRRSREAGIDHHLTKPIEVSRILGLLANRAASRQGAGASE